MNKILAASGLAVLAFLIGFAVILTTPSSTITPQNPRGGRGYQYAITPQPCGPFTATGQNLTWTPGSCDAGHRFKICLTVTDALNQTATTCQFLNVRGACTIYTADLNMDNKVDISDLVLVANEFGQIGSNLAGDLYGNGSVTLRDLTCVASWFGQPVPAF